MFPLQRDWQLRLQQELEAPYFQKLLQTLAQEKNFYPPKELVFETLNQVSYQKCRVVLIGQDPYHGPGQAMGLSFSVPEGVTIPPSLRNINKEIEADIGPLKRSHSSLMSWTTQGVLLLNAILTVRPGEPASHKNLGWEKFTDKVLQLLNQREEPLVFMLWGNYAKRKGAFLDRKKHLVLESGHPSPLSVRFFRGNKHFSKANSFLEKNGLPPIIWN